MRWTNLGNRAMRQDPDSEAAHAALRAGNQAAVQAALTELLPSVRGWLYRLLGPRSDLDDAVQDALIELAKAFPRFEGRSTLRTLAHKITVRVAYRYFGRRRRQEPSLELVAPPVDEIDPESRTAGREALRRLFRCLERMPEKRRVAFVLCAVEGLTPAEAAEVEGISSLAMRSRLLHARTEVSRMLKLDPYFSAWTGTSGTGEA